MGLTERVDAEIDRTRGELLDWLGRLIRIPSVTGDEGPAQAFVADAARALDLPVDVWEFDRRELEGRHGYGLTDLEYAGRPNVVARLAGR